MIVWFKYVDIYHTHFSSTGALILLHNLFRVLFVFYLFWIVQAVGAAVLRLLGADLEALGPLEYLALTFFAGTGPWHVVLLAVGYSNLLDVLAMVLLTAPVVALSFFELRFVMPGLRALLRKEVKRASNATRGICILAGLALLALLLVKGLYPGGSQDYFVHYFHAYEAVLDHASIRPAETWWHYLNTKGAGLVFLGMLLADPLAQRLVVFCFMAVAGLVMFLFVRRIAPRTIWPGAAVLLFFGIYIYTPKWGEFGKLHEFNTAFVIAILWMTVVALDPSNRDRRSWLFAAGSATTAAILINPHVAVFLGVMFGALALAYAAMRERRRALACLALASLAAVVCSCLLLINFLTVGLPHDLALSFWWKFADVEKLHRWGALPMVLWVHWVYSRPPVPLIESFNFLTTVLRLYLLWPLFLGGLFIAGTSAWRRYRAGDLGKRPVPDGLLVLLAAIAAISLLYLTSGRVLASSFFRFSSFIVPVMIVAGIAMWTAPIGHATKGALVGLARHPRIPFVVLAVCAGVIAGRTPFDRNVLRLGANALEHAVGVLSIDAAYARQFGGHLIAPWGGIYPGARGAYAVVGPHVPIWSMHLDSYCMLPDCRMMTFWQFIMTRSWDRVMWGTPEEGEAALRAAGINYFLVSFELRSHDPLRLSPLFSPDNIGKYLGIRWTDRTTSLLTWRGSDTTAPDDAWLARYRRFVTPPVVPQGPSGLKEVFNRLNAMPHPWRSFELPWSAR